MDLLALAQGDRMAAHAAAHAAWSNWQALGRRGEESLALRQLGILALLQGDPDAARACFEQGLAAARAAGHPIGEGLNLWGRAQVSAYQEAFAAAHRDAEAARACFAEVGWRRGLVNILGFLGDLRYVQGEPAAAQRLLEQNLALARELGADSLSCSTLVRLGEIAVEKGDLRRAAALLRESLQASARLGDRASQAAGVAACVQLAAAGGDAQRALRLASAAGRLRGGSAVGGPASAVRAPARAREVFARRVAAIRDSLAAGAAAGAWEEGQTLSWDAALEEALAACEAAA
jgi:tetratricopeptide (TPR) repeat protein